MHKYSQFNKMKPGFSRISDKGISREYFADNGYRVLWYTSSCWIIKVHPVETEPLRVTRVPFKVVHQWPRGVSFHIGIVQLNSCRKNRKTYYFSHQTRNLRCYNLSSFSMKQKFIFRHYNILMHIRENWDTRTSREEIFNMIIMFSARYMLTNTYINEPDNLFSLTFQGLMKVVCVVSTSVIVIKITISFRWDTILCDINLWIVVFLLDPSQKFPQTPWNLEQPTWTRTRPFTTSGTTRFLKIDREDIISFAVFLRSRQAIRFRFSKHIYTPKNLNFQEKSSFKDWWCMILMVVLKYFMTSKRESEFKQYQEWIL